MTRCRVRILLSSLSFFLLSFSFLFPFRYFFVCLFVLLLMFLKYIPSRAKIVFLWINNLNFYRFLQFLFLFYCNILYKTKTVATCSHKLPFLLYWPSFDCSSLLAAREACFELSTSCESCCHINSCLSLVSVIALYLK